MDLMAKRIECTLRLRTYNLTYIYSGPSCADLWVVWDRIWCMFEGQVCLSIRNRVVS